MEKDSELHMGWGGGVMLLERIDKFGSIAGVITNVKFADNVARLKVSVGGNSLTAEMPYPLFEDMDLAVGKEVFLILKLRRIRAYKNKDSG